MQKLFSRFVGQALAAGSLLVLVGACATPYYVLVKPVAPVGWQRGLEVVEVGADSVNVQVGVVSTSGPWLEFDVTVQNRSSRTLLVAPEEFYLDAASQTPGVGPLRVQADNPELHIQQLQQQAAYHQQQSTAVPAAEVLSSLSNRVDDVTSHKRKETEEQRNARTAAYQADMARREQERTSQAVKALTVRDEQRTLEETALRKTTLAPGYALNGRVRFSALCRQFPTPKIGGTSGERRLTAEFSQQRIQMNGRIMPVAQGTPVGPAAPQAPAAHSVR